MGAYHPDSTGIHVVYSIQADSQFKYHVSVQTSQKANIEVHDVESQKFSK
jgi:hypothetical protein